MRPIHHYQHQSIPFHSNAFLELEVDWNARGGGRTQTSQSINTINIHRAAPANTLSTAPAKRECGIHLVLDPNQRVEHHGPGLVQVQRVRLHPRLRGRLVGVPAVDVEGLDLGVGLLGGRGGYACHAADAHGRAYTGTQGREGAGREA